MSEIGDESDEVRQLREALELRPGEIDAATRERHLARALDEFDDTGVVVPMRRRWVVPTTAAAAVVLVIVGIGALLASRGHDDITNTRAEAPATTASAAAAPATTTVPSPLGTKSSSSAAATRSLGDFPTVEALRAAALANRREFDQNAKSATTAPNAAEYAPPTVTCPAPPLGGDRVVDRIAASVAHAPVTVWIVDTDTRASDVIVVDDATCTVRSG